ncbi:ABC transporter substrate-binding protein [Vagococcus carniphilus]|uniref:ABC transporter substrate-binding protein n=1 Tax=Vagococcus carniphilus TaxID=218144 RepID=A0AAW8U7M1_9ENTE|nr:ABC transporter substrate-binding protein [Vagococcus carniphilus]MDT2814911.1 ABC transporter substrate-binding protein [Vagococcus carniphilus]MDT2831747.1 ABC transporter substrate-binding protein [Vagococcus carniphilus]MDT2835094.1 ABC transporter substrate-binding protein [Vagococcus carniphilus]MDT2840600.1 ABC transporter substrate-binding protein [Vagococcus carniphilus]MDT2849962.1 ABC transporter substrate-binding protein [Vagococcus carniphilus]
MKKLNSLIIGIVGIIVLLTFTAINIEKKSGSSGSEVITIYNWGDYIDPSLLKQFEKEYGYKVIYETFDSNEAMITKIEQGGTAYDIAIPSEYMIQKMMKQNLLLKLDHSKIKGLENIDPRFLNIDFDEGNQYSVPYFWGTLGIIYNDKFVKEENMQHWNDLWRPELKNNVMLIDGAREVIGLALNSEGYSLNSKNDAELTQISEKLTGLTNNVKAIVADEIKMYMINEESAVAVSFSGEASEMLDNNEHLHYVIPEEGSNLWFDNIVIPRTAKNVKGSYDFINFMLRPENAAKNAEYIGYSTPNKKAVEILPKEITTDEQFYPDEATMKNLEVYEDLGSKYLEVYNDRFLEFKMYRK